MYLLHTFPKLATEATKLQCIIRTMRQLRRRLASRRRLGKTSFYLRPHLSTRPPWRIPYMFLRFVLGPHDPLASLSTPGSPSPAAMVLQPEASVSALPEDICKEHQAFHRTRCVLSKTSALVTEEKTQQRIKSWSKGIHKSGHRNGAELYRPTVHMSSSQ